MRTVKRRKPCQCVCDCRPVSLYSIAYIYSRKSALPLFLVSKCEPTQNRLRQAETRENSIKETRKKQDSSSNQRSDTNKKDKHRFNNTFVCFQAIKRVIEKICKNVPQAIAARFNSKVHVNTGKSLRIRARHSTTQPVWEYLAYTCLNRRVYG